MTTTTTMVTGVAAIFLMAAGCGDSGGATDTDAPASSTGADTGTSEGPGTDPAGTDTDPGTDPNPGTDTDPGDPTGEDPTTGPGTDATTDTSTGGDPLTPDELVGQFVSGGCEAYPDGMGGMNYLTRDFTLTGTTWHLELALYMDDACATKLFSSVIDGPYTLGAASAAVDGATEGEFGIVTNVWTAHQGFMADTFTQQGCGAAPWVVEEPQDVAQTGCIGVAHPVADCPQEYDIVALSGDDLFFGQRVTDLCVPEGRPTALAAFPVTRQ